MTDRTDVDPSRWLDAYGDFLYRYALVRVRDPRVAEDLVQETLLAALEGWHRFEGRSSERTWLVGILKHKIVDYFRRQANPVEQASGEAAIEREVFNRWGRWKHPPMQWPALDPLQVLEREEFYTVLMQCLRAIPERMAAVFVLRELEGWSTEAICKRLEITPTNLWVIIHRARLRLRKCLEQLWFQREAP